jgi:hypothetical protein
VGENALIRADYVRWKYVTKRVISSQDFRNELQHSAIEELYNAGVKNYPEFKVFLTSYAHSFNVDADSKRCNNISFGPGFL